MNTPKKLQIVHYPDPVLRRKTKFIKKFGPDLVRLGEQMLKFMVESNGIGLAAPQVGISKKMVVVHVGEGHDPLILINPKVTWKSNTTESYVEGCLSLPSIEGPVERPLKIKVRAQHPENGEEYEFEAEGLEARCIQHELDHLDGVLFIDHLAPKDRFEVQGGLRDLERALA